MMKVDNNNDDDEEEDDAGDHEGTIIYLTHLCFSWLAVADAVTSNARLLNQFIYKYIFLVFLGINSPYTMDV